MGCCVTKQVVIVDDIWGGKDCSHVKNTISRQSCEKLLHPNKAVGIKERTLSAQDSLNLQFLASVTYFDEKEILVLRELFKRFGCLSNNDSINKSEFCLAVFNDKQSNIFADRIFQLFDKRSLGKICFDEFVYALNVFHPLAPLLEKARFAFQLYDIDNTGHIRPEELKCFLVALFKDNTLMLPENVIDQIIVNTIKEMDFNKSGTITLKEWFSSVQKKPSLIGYMTLPSLRELALGSRPASVQQMQPEL